MKFESSTRICEEFQVARPFYQAHHVGMSIFPPFRGFQHGNRLLLLLIIEIVLHLEQLPQWFLLQDDLRYGTPGFYGSFMLEVATRGPFAYISYMHIYIYTYDDLKTDITQIAIEAIQEYLCMSAHDVWSEIISIHCRFEGKPPKHVFYTQHIFDKSTQFDIKPIKFSSQFPTLSHPEKGHVQSHSADSQCTCVSCVSCIFVPPALFWLSGALFSPSATESDTVQSIIFEMALLSIITQLLTIAHPFERKYRMRRCTALLAEVSVTFCCYSAIHGKHVPGNTDAVI